MSVEWFKLSGILIILIGMALRLRPTFVVLVAAFVTGQLAGLSFPKILSLLGQAFSDNRMMTLFFLTLPTIGLCERYGLHTQAAAIIQRVQTITFTRLQLIYQIFRIFHGMMGIRLNGHPAFVRPLLYPMSLGAVQRDRKVPLPAGVIERIKAANAGVENYSNFYGQNLSVVQAGILLIYGVMKGLGYEVSLWRLMLFTLPIVVLSLILSALQMAWLERSLEHDLQTKETQQ